MGLFNRSKSGRATVTAALQSASAGPGGTVTLTYEIGGALDDSCQRVVAGLTCIATYITPERGRDASGHPIERDVGHEVTLHDDQQQLPVAIGSGQAQFKVPDDAAPSSADAVAWQAWVQIDRGDAASPIERVPLAVRAPAGRSDPGPDGSQGGVTLHGVPRSVQAGELVGGTLTVSLPDDVKVSSVTVRLNRRRTYVANPLTDGDARALLIDTAQARGIPYSAYQFLGVVETQVFGRHEFAAGQAEETSFSITVPGDAGPSTMYPYGQVDWRLEAVLARRLHDDLTVAIPITVT
jgi:hypothetical protein